MCMDLYGNLTCYDVDAARYIQAFLISINATVMILGNALALYIVYHIKALQDAAFCFLMNLALTDLLLGLISQPPSLYYAITCQWLGGATGLYCQFVGFSICLLCSVSLISLGLVSYERYHYTVHPFQHINSFTFRKSVYACVFVWIYAAVASVFPVIGLWEGVGLQPYNALCNIQWEIEPIYMAAMIAFVLCPSGALITFSYFHILRVARKANKVDTIKHRVVLGSSISRTVDDNVGSSAARVPDQLSRCDNSRGDISVISAPRENPKKEARTKKAALKKSKLIKMNKSTFTVGLLVGTFVVCWTPYVIVSTVQSLRCTPNSFAVTAFAQWMCMFNSACNPLIYGVTNKTFREGVGKFLQGLKFWKHM